MPERIGVVAVSPWTRVDFKRELLLFERLALVNRLVVNREAAPGRFQFELTHKRERPGSSDKLIARTEAEAREYVERRQVADYLLDAGIAFEVDNALIEAIRETPEALKLADQFLKSAEPLRAQHPVGSESTMGEMAASLVTLGSRLIPLNLRVHATALREHGWNAVPVLSTHFNASFPSSGESGADIVQVVIRALPLPSETTSIQQILEFRSDPDALLSLWELHRWVEHLSASPVAASDAENELQYLIARHEQFLRAHGIHYRFGHISVVSVLTAALEELANLNLGSAARTLFSIRKQKTDLLQAELSAPGREVAYIVRARHVLGRRD